MTESDEHDDVEERLAELGAMHERRLGALEERLESTKREKGSAAKIAALKAQCQAERYNLEVLRYHHKRLLEDRPVLSQIALDKLLADTGGDASGDLGDLGVFDGDDGGGDDRHSSDSEERTRSDLEPSDGPDDTEWRGKSDDNDEDAISPVISNSERSDRSQARKPRATVGPGNGVASHGTALPLGSSPGSLRLSRRVAKDLEDRAREERLFGRPFRANPVPDYVKQRRRKSDPSASVAKTPPPANATPSGATPAAQKAASSLSPGKRDWVKYGKPAPAVGDPSSTPVSPFKAKPVPHKGEVKSKFLRPSNRTAYVPPEPTFKPEISTEVPDFAKLHEALDRQATKTREQYYPTIIQEFNLHSGSRSNSSKVMADIERDNQTLRETRWPFKSPRAAVPLGTLCTAHGPPPKPIKSTLAVELRAGKTRLSLAEKERKEREAEERHERLAEQQRRLAKKMAARMPNASSRVEELERQRRVQENLEDIRRHEEEYRASMEQRMRELEDARVFLFERQSADTAMSRVESDFERAVGGTGLSPRQFRSKTREHIRSFVSETRPVEVATHSPPHQVPAGEEEEGSVHDGEDEGDVFEEDFEEEDEQPK